MWRKGFPAVYGSANNAVDLNCLVPVSSNKENFQSTRMIEFSHVGTPKTGNIVEFAWCRKDILIHRKRNEKRWETVLLVHFCIWWTAFLEKTSCFGWPLESLRESVARFPCQSRTAVHKKWWAMITLRVFMYRRIQPPPKMSPPYPNIRISTASASALVACRCHSRPAVCTPSWQVNHRRSFVHFSAVYLHEEQLQNELQLFCDERSAKVFCLQCGKSEQQVGLKSFATKGASKKLLRRACLYTITSKMCWERCYSEDMLRPQARNGQLLQHLLLGAVADIRHDEWRRKPRSRVGAYETSADSQSLKCVATFKYASRYYSVTNWRWNAAKWSAISEAITAWQIGDI